MFTKAFFVSFKYAATGLLRTLAEHRNFKFHWVSGFMVTIVGMALPLGQAARAALIFSIFLVIFAEILNTALEAFVDLHIKEFHDQAMVAKDAAAGGVFILAIAVLAVFVDVLVTDWEMVVGNWPSVKRALIFGLPATAVVIAWLIVPMPRLVQWLLLVIVLALLFPQALHSFNGIFSVIAHGFAVVAFCCRLLYPLRPHSVADEAK